MIDKNAVMKYHSRIPVGKIGTSIKPCSLEQLQLAYTPGVGLVCQEIAANPDSAWNLTSRGNNVCVVSNGTAILGLGDLGALAGKPVMEGKALLMQKLAGISATELCIEEKNPTKLIDIIKACAPSMGCINLEDIKAPECFDILKQLQEELDIPVFHDDQDGTAVVVAAAVLNALRLTGKDICQVKLVASGAGAAMIASLRLLEEFGLDSKKVYLFDSKGIIHSARDVPDYKMRYAQANQSLPEALEGADIFLGLSAGNLLKGDDIKQMSEQPIVLAMANPTPEIMPDSVLAARPDAVVGTGRSDFPNQVNNCTCFPYLFRAVLDSRATKITLGMLRAVVEGIVDLVGEDLSTNYIMPSTTDPRLPYYIVPRVIDAAIADGVAKEVDRTLVHKYLFESPWWNLELQPRNCVVSSTAFLPVDLFSAKDPQQHWTVNSALPHQNSADLMHLFASDIAGESGLFTVGRHALHALPNFSVDLDFCKSTHDYIGCIDLEGKIAYVNNDYRKAMFIAAFVSTL